MQKKVIALAVAGALAAPAVAMAQSTVQVYGNLYIEYAFTNQKQSAAGTGLTQIDRVDADILQTGGSAVGFKGEEKLGGGMSAWFQCESTADPRGASQDGWCSRNSAVGLKGGFGNFFVGNWDTPFKRTMVNVGGRDTGVFGTAFLLTGGSTTILDGATEGLFRRRQNNSINYDSPNFGGFQVMASTTSTNASTGVTTTSAQDKERLWSLGAQYAQGPIKIGAAYEQHDKFYPGGGDESGWHVGGSYTFGNFTLGGQWVSMEADTAPGATAEVDTWHVGVEWKIAGPHALHFGYTKADDMEGTVGAVMGTGATATRPAVGGPGALPGNTVRRSTSADMFQIRYLYSLSKRTTASVGYVALKNDDGASYDLGGLNYPAAAAGAKQSAVAVSVQHRF